MLGIRIHQARKAKGLSLRDVAKEVGVSATMLSKYERGVATPSSDVLLALAAALGVRTEYFFRTAEVTLEKIAHRKRDKLPEKQESRVLADVRDQLERWSALDKVLPAPWSVPFSLPGDLPERIQGLDDIEDIAVQVREHWDLGLNPIADLIDTLELRGVLVFRTRFDGDERFEGLSASANGRRVVVVGAHWPGDRQRFTLAHELGHLVLDSRLAPTLDREKAADRFAGAFIVPAPKVRECLGERRKSIDIYELYLLKHEFGLSISAWTYRCLHAGVITQQLHRKLWSQLVRKGWDKQEPGKPYPQEVPRLFEQSVYRAMGEDLISESKAAELLGIAHFELADRRRMKLDADHGVAAHGDHHQ